MKKVLFIFLTLLITGCGKINPMSPELKQEIHAQDGKIEELKNNQDGFNLELGKIHNNQKLQADKLDNLQQGIVNLKGSSNSGIQILSGDGALITLFSLLVVAMIFIYYYKTKSAQHEKVATLMAQHIAGDTNLENQVFMSAMNHNVEHHIFKLFNK